MAFAEATEFLQRKDPYLEPCLATYNIIDGERHSAFHSYLKPALKRKNLSILLNTRVTKANITHILT